MTKTTRVLLVEDHADTRMALCMYLEQLGHTVTNAGTIAEALAKEEAANCSVLISDIGLPDGTGWDLMYQLKKRQPIYGIAISGFGTTMDTRRSKLAGFQYHLVKPIDLDELCTILTSIDSDKSFHSAPQTQRKGDGI